MGEMDRLTRAAPLPQVMQGRWKSVEEALPELIIDGGEVSRFGEIIDYDYKYIKYENGNLLVDLNVDGEADANGFRLEKITTLIFTVNGDFWDFSESFAMEYKREIEQ